MEGSGQQSCPDDLIPHLLLLEVSVLAGKSIPTKYLRHQVAAMTRRSLRPGPDNGDRERLLRKPNQLLHRYHFRSSQTNVSFSSKGTL